MTDTCTQIYEKILSEQGIDDELIDGLTNDDLIDDDLIDDDLIDDDLIDDDLAINNIVRHERIQPPIKIIEFPTEDSLPKITEESIKLAEYFHLRSNEVHYGDVLYKIRNDGLEIARLDMTSIISHWFPEKNARWISLQCIGASNYCASSDGDICHIHRRRLQKCGKLAYAMAVITLDNGIKLRIPVHCLIVSAFWEFPFEPKMTVDHRNRLSRDNSIDNLSWEPIEVQLLNRRKFLRKSIPVNQVDPTSRKVIKEWNSTKEIAKYFNVRYHTISSAIQRHYIFNDSLWQYHEPLLPGEEFKSIPIEGIDDIYISNKGRCLLRNGHIVIGHPTIDGYRLTSLLNKLTNMKNYFIHILVAMTWIPNDCPAKNIVNHKNHVRDNNCVENLEWMTASENSKHANKLRRRVSYIDENGQHHEFSSITEASNVTNIHYTNIIKECRKSKMGKIAKFSYIDNNVKGFSENGIPIVQCNLLDENKLFVWCSMSCAELYTGISKALIIDALRGKNRSAGGFFWRRVNIFEASQDVTNIDNISTLKYKGLICVRESIVEIYRMRNLLVVNKHKNVSEAAKAIKISRDTITNIAKFRRNGYNMCDGTVRWFLYQDEYEKRVMNNEPLIKPVESHDNKNRPIVIMTLEGDFITKYASVKEVILYVKANITYKGSITPCTIIDIAKGHAHTLDKYRFAFAEDYYSNPKSYKENLHISILRKIKERKTN